MPYFAGIDVGACTTKAIIINQQTEVLGSAVTDSGVDFKAAADSAFAKAAAGAGLDAGRGGPAMAAVVSTGYGRRNVPFAGSSKTEISCHARGSFHSYPRAHTLIDIGGQDNKVIRIDVSGKRVGFKMNRKCAAGTGAFLEEIANRLKIPIGDLDGLARKGTREVELGSYCTVFTATEILARIREGVKVEDLVKGVFGAVIKRAVEMDPLDGSIVMTGGVVAHNPYLVEMFSRKLGKDVFVPPLSQLTGALGAALYALDGEGGQDA
jgi:predicted CoA-substrate-specific enzyme activase